MKNDLMIGKFRIPARIAGIAAVLAVYGLMLALLLAAETSGLLHWLETVFHG